MTDTDKLKRLAEASIEARGWSGNVPPPPHIAFSHSAWESACTPDAILALIAENERLLEEVDTQRSHASYANQLMDQRVTAMLTRCEERDEAVELLREVGVFSGDVERANHSPSSPALTAGFKLAALSCICMA